MKLSQLIKILPFYEVKNNHDPDILSIEMDNREVEPGALFFCITGNISDGHSYANSAIKKGAVALIVEKELPLDIPMVIVKDSRRAMATIAAYFYNHPTEALKIIGVTGTNGKTTTTHLIDHILRDQKKSAGLIGTMYMKYGNETVQVKNTTPESLILQKHFSNMRNQKVEFVSMEISSHALLMGRLHGTDINIAVFTNLSQDHLDYHSTMDEYAYAKSLLFSQLGSSRKIDEFKLAIINEDDSYAELFKRASAVPILTYGIDKEADFKAEDVVLTEKGASFNLIVKNQLYPVNLQMAGRFSVYNALAALAVSYSCGLSLVDSITSLAALTGVAGRFEKVITNAPFSIIVDYAHTPDSLKNVLSTINEYTSGKIITVVGCGGDRDKKKRPLMAQIAEEKSNLLILTSDNPRSENPEDILSDMKKGLKSPNDSLIFVDREKAIREAVLQAQNGDVILIAGKGHENYQEIKGEKIFFDDRESAKAAIADRYS